jgi:PPK2 family polyphosphate:nucleotide phosphotransferase
MLDIDPFRVTPGSAASLVDRDPRATTGFSGKKDQARAELPELRQRLDVLQHRLWAESKRGVLLVLQGLDTSGKDGTIKNVFKGVNPQGVKVWSFVKPSPLELAHDYLWRVHLRTPTRGSINIFNRSHYEDILVVRVNNLVPEERWSRRYDHIRNFERMLSDEGTVIIKLFLNISKDEQKDRLQARVNNELKNWKFDEGDLETRKKWDDYQEAYEVALTETSTENAPWYVVPADRKWFRNLLVSTIMVKTLEDMDIKKPPPNRFIEGLVID